MNYFKILLFLEKGNRRLFNYPKDEQKEFLNSLGEARDDIDRGYKQYLCQNQFVRPRWKVALFNIGGETALPFVALYFLTKRLWATKETKQEALLMSAHMPEVVPLCLHEQYRIFKMGKPLGTSLSFSDLGFVLKLWAKSLAQPYFAFKAMMNVAQYSDAIYRHRPQVMIQFGEFSFSSSILTAFCHRHGVKHIDVMHGEKLFNIRDAYFHYDECYVWDRHYVELLKSLKAEPTQFRIAVPPSLKIEIAQYKNEAVYADYKYYLAGYDENTLAAIVAAMAFARREGKSVKYRPHPRYSNVGLLKRYVSDEEIEMPQEVGIQESVANVGCAVGSYTTVMVQAHFSGKQVMMDDVAEAEQHRKLRSLDYILSGDNFDKLSEHQ